MQIEDTWRVRLTGRRRPFHSRHQATHSMAKADEEQRGRLLGTGGLGELAPRVLGEDRTSGGGRRHVRGGPLGMMLLYA